MKIFKELPMENLLESAPRILLVRKTMICRVPLMLILMVLCCCTHPPVTPSIAYYVFTANQISNDVSAYSLDISTGALTPVSGSPYLVGTHPRSVAVDPSGKHLYVANML